jgi:membrane associated rhomboid family serine protease
MLIPIGLDQTSVRRLPWVSFSIIAINILVFLAASTAVHSAEEAISRRGQAVMSYWTQHPYLEFPTRMLPKGMSEAQREKFTLLTEGLKSIAGKAPESEDQRREEQRELDGLVDNLQEALAYHPFKAWGLVPAHPKVLAFLTSLFMHAGWLHLLGNMLFFYISGPFVEDAFGRPLFAALYLASGVVSSLVHVAAFPTSEAPLVGASGAIAGIMGAFLVRFVRTKIRFFYFYFIFFFRSGTVDLPAWIVLPLWFLQQLFFAGLTAESGVAYRAHVGGFAFGFVAALAIKFFAIEERFIAPKIEKEISVTQHPALEEGMDLLARGETAAAREAFQKVLASEPRNADAHLGIWQSHCQDGTPAQGVEHVVRAVDEELRFSETALALTHWREMLAATGNGGPGALRFRLGTMLEATDREAAVEVLRHLAADAGAGLLSEKAARRLTTLGVQLPSVAPAAVAPSAAPTEGAVGPPGEVFTPPAVHTPERPIVVPAQPAAGPFEEERPAQLMSQQPASQVFPEVSAPEQTAPPVVQPAGMEVEDCTLDTLQSEGLMLRATVGGCELLPFAEIERVVVGGITGAEHPYLVLDLVLHPSSGEPRKVQRLVSSEFDPRHLVGRPDLPALQAFRELVRIIAEGAKAEITPATLLEPSAQLPTFASVEDYEREMLAALA